MDRVHSLTSFSKDEVCNGLKDELDFIDKEREGISDGEESGCKGRKQDVLDVLGTQDGYRVRLG